MSNISKRKPCEFLKSDAYDMGKFTKMRKELPEEELRQ